MTHRTRPVFVDATGRRRRLVTVAGALLGLGLVAGIAVLVVSVVTGSAPLPLPGLPASGQGLQQEQTAPAEEPAPTPAARVPSGTPTITPAASAPPAAPPASTVSPVTGSSTRGNRPTANPGNPKWRQRHRWCYRVAGRCSARHSGGEGLRARAARSERVSDLTPIDGVTVPTCGAKGNSGSLETLRRTRRGSTA